MSGDPAPTSRRYDLREVVACAALVLTSSVTGLVGGGVIGNRDGAPRKADSQLAQDNATQLAVLSSQFKAQSDQLQKVLEVVDAMKKLLIDRTTDRYPRGEALQALSNLKAELQGEIREVRSQQDAHESVKGHPRTRGELEEVRRIQSQRDEELKEIRRELKEIQRMLQKQ